MKKFFVSLLCVMMIVTFMPVMTWAADGSADSDSTGDTVVTADPADDSTAGESGDTTTGETGTPGDTGGSDDTTTDPADEPDDSTDPVTLDISEGSITITATGYKQGEDTEETSYTGSYVITQTGGQTTDKTVDISGVAEGATVTLKSLNMRYNNTTTTPKGAVNVTSGNVKLLLEDSNVLTGGSKGAQAGAMYITGGAAVTLDGTGKLTATGENWTPGIFVASTSTLVIDGGTINATGSNSAAGIGVNYYNGAGTIIINGGIITAKGGAYNNNSYGCGIGGSFKVDGSTVKQNCEKVTINGGTVTAISANSSYSSAVQTKNFIINGGSVNLSNMRAASTKPQNDNGERVYLSPIYVQDTDGSLLKNTVVEITADGKTWTAQTNADGKIYAYVTDGENKTVTYKGESWSITTGYESSVGVACTCDESSSSIAWDDVTAATIYKGMDSVSVNTNAAFNKAENCAAKVHYGFSAYNISISGIEAENATVTDVSEYASYSAGKLVLKNKGTDYTVTLKAESLNGKLTAEKRISVTYVDYQGFDLTAGSITVSADETDAAKTVYTQGGTSYTAAADEIVAITGNGTTANSFTITSGTANVLFDNVNITSTDANDNDGASGIIKVNGGTLNLKLKGTNVLRRAGCVIYVGKVGSTTASNAVLNVSCSEEGSCSDEDCPDSLTVRKTFGRTAAIGGARNDGGAAGTINIESGKVAVFAGADAAAIGSPNAGCVYVYDINVAGGCLDVTYSGANGTAIGLGRGSAAGSIANINITGGVVNAASVGSTGTAIGSSDYSQGNINLVIGSDDSTDNSKPIVNASSSSSTAIGVHGNANCDMSIEIKSGTVNAKTNGNVAIGYAMNGSYGTQTGERSITITGGIVNATGSNVGIGGYGPASYGEDYTKTESRNWNVDVTIGGDAQVTATGSDIGIGALGMGANSTLNITIEGEADVTAVTQNGIAIGSLVGTAKGAEAKENGTTLMISDSAAVTLSGKIAIASAAGDMTADISTTGDVKLTGTVKDEVVIQAGTPVTVTAQNGEKITLTTPTGEDAGDIEISADGIITVPDGTKVTTGTGDEQMTTTLPDGGTVDTSDGSITPAEGGSVITENPDGTVTVTDKDGNTTTITPPEGSDEEVSVSPDGTITVPGGTKVTTGSGDDQTTTILPSGGTIDASNDGTISIEGSVITENADGNETTITPPAGEKVEVGTDGTITVPGGTVITKGSGDDQTTTTIPTDTVGSITVPADKIDEVEVKEDGSMSLPKGTVVTTKDGTTTTLPDGGTVNNDGSIAPAEGGSVITENPDGTVTVTDKDGNETTITPPNGENVQVNDDGTITVPGGTEITKGSGDDQTTATIPTDTVSSITVPADKIDEVEVKEDGSMSLPKGTEVTTKDSEGNETTTTLTNGGTVNEDGSITKNPVGGGGYVPDAQKPVIEASEGSSVTLSSDGTKATITVADGYELVDVTVNGVSKGKVDTLTGLKTGDKVVVTAQKTAAEPTLEEQIAAAKEEMAKVNSDNFYARSKMVTMKSGKKAVKVTWYTDSGVEFDGVEIFRSVKRYSGFGTKPVFSTSKAQYYNTAINKGTRYYYKVRGYKVIGGEKIYTDWSLKAWRTVK